MRYLFLVLCFVVAMEDEMTNRVLNKFYGKRQQSIVDLGAVRAARRRAARQDNYQVALTQISGGSAEVARRLTGGSYVAPSLRTTDYARQTATATPVAGIPIINMSFTFEQVFLGIAELGGDLSSGARTIIDELNAARGTGSGSPAPTRTTTPKITIL